MTMAGDSANGVDDDAGLADGTAQAGTWSSKICWYQCTVKGGREGRDVDAMQLAQVCEKLGAGEILLNCIDKDGTNSGFDTTLIKHISEGVYRYYTILF
jgi:glutamine amidotransferase/cyclase